jgi:hypothetical protein
MSGKTDQIKGLVRASFILSTAFSAGRIKEAAGVLVDNDRVKRKRKLDQVVGQQTPRWGQVVISSLCCNSVGRKFCMR